MNCNIQEYLGSGVVEEYCLGFLSPEQSEKFLRICSIYPQAKAYLMDVQESMQHIFQQHNKKAPARCKSVIRNSILANLQLESASLQGDHQLLDEFIPISRHSDCVRWEQLVEPIQPKENYKNVYLKSLFASNGQELTLIWAKQLIPEEVHSDVDESFLLLEGTVDCFIEEDIFHMKKGDFMRIPLGISHKIMVTSATPAKAILSRVQL